MKYKTNVVPIGEFPISKGFFYNYNIYLQIKQLLFIVYLYY